MTTHKEHGRSKRLFMGTPVHINDTLPFNNYVPNEGPFCKGRWDVVDGIHLNDPPEFHVSQRMYDQLRKKAK